MIDPTISAFLGIILGGLITATTNYLLNRQQFKREEIAEGVKFYRSMLPRIQPINRKIQEIRDLLIYLETANNEILNERNGFPVILIDTDDKKTLDKSELRAEIFDKKLPELVKLLYDFPEVHILPFDVAQSPFLLLIKLGELSKDWDAPPRQILKQIKSITNLVNCYKLSVTKMLGLLTTSKHIEKSNPNLTKNLIKTIEEMRKQEKKK